MSEQDARMAEYPEPTEADLADPLFEAVWQAVKGWDMSRRSNGLYSGATGNDVMHILNAVRPFLSDHAAAIAILEALRDRLRDRSHAAGVDKAIEVLQGNPHGW